MSSAGREAGGTRGKSVVALAPCRLPLVTAACMRNRHERAAAGSEHPGASTYDDPPRMEGGGLSCLDTDTTDTQRGEFCRPDLHRPGPIHHRQGLFGQVGGQSGGASRTATSGRQRAMGVLRANTSPASGLVRRRLLLPLGNPLRQATRAKRRDRHHAVGQRAYLHVGPAGDGAAFASSRPPCTPRMGRNDQCRRSSAEKFALKRGRWNWIAVKQKLGSTRRRPASYGSTAER